MTSETLSVPVLTAEDIANAKIRDAASDLLKALRDCVESGTLAHLTPNTVRKARAAILKMESVYAN